MENKANSKVENRADERIRREVIFIDTPASDRGNTAGAKVKTKGEELADAVEQQGEVTDESAPRTKSIWQHITTGSLLTSGAVPSYRYLIAIAVMCFMSIFLTFMSLNADREYRRKKERIDSLQEHAVLMEERRYNLSSKSAVTERLREYGIELIDLSNDSRLLE